MPVRFTIRSTSADDWQEVRAQRLRMLRDTPIAFGESLRSAEQQDERAWRARGTRGEDPTRAQLVAIAEDGSWLGTMGGYLPRPGDPDKGPMLVSVYVEPVARGSRSGVTDALLDAIEDWARPFGPTLSLHVHEDNARAMRFYERRGFVRTGRVMSYPLDPSSREVEMRETL